jgi:glycerol-3-phosphate dehydrogenase
VAPRTLFDRQRALAHLREDTFDVLVIGGGITGAGVALDAAARGLRTALVDKGDFASGTSSESSKLIHGGLRYLQQRDFRLVYEALAERQRLLENAPHLVSPLPFLIPLFGKDGVANLAIARAYSTALWLYDVTGGLRIGKRHRRVSREEALEDLPGLNTERLVAGFLYWDARADDARVTLTVLRTAVCRYGAVAANYSPVAELTKDPSTGSVNGARLSDGTEVRASIVVNAAGVWSDLIRALDEGPAAHGTLRPAKGIHLVFPASRLPARTAAVLPVPHERRTIFVVPWGDFTYAGTTDTDYDGPLDDPQCTAADIAYVLDALNASLTQPLSQHDIVGTWAGLRPLVRAARSERTADLSRRHQIRVSDDGVVSITGGKLTTYRRMASDAVDEVVRRLGSGGKRSATKRLPLLGGEGFASLRSPEAPARLGVSPDRFAHLVGRYGSEARTVIAMIEADPDLGRPLVPGLPYLRAEAVYAVRYEMAMTVEDVLSRRTRSLLLARDAAAAAAVDVAHLIAPELGWTPERISTDVEAFRARVVHARTAAGLPETSLLVGSPGEDR